MDESFLSTALWLLDDILNNSVINQTNIEEDFLRSNICLESDNKFTSEWKLSPIIKIPWL